MNSIDEDIAEGQRMEYERQLYQEELTFRSLKRRLRRLEKKLGLPHHEFIFQPGKKVYDEMGHLLMGHIPKAGEKFYTTQFAFGRIDRRVGAIYIYTPELGMPLIKKVMHECLERMEDERDKPAVDAINSLIKHLHDLVTNILKDEHSSPQLVQLAIAKRDEVGKLVSEVGENIYQAREKVVEKLIDQAIRTTPVTEDEEADRVQRLEEDPSKFGKRDRAFVKYLKREEEERTEALRYAFRKLGLLRTTHFEPETPTRRPRRRKQISKSSRGPPSCT